MECIGHLALCLSDGSQEMRTIIITITIITIVITIITTITITIISITITTTITISIIEAVLHCLEGEPQGWGRPRGERGSQPDPSLCWNQGLSLINSSWQKFLAGHVCLPVKSQVRFPGAAHWP